MADLRKRGSDPEKLEPKATTSVEDVGPPVDVEGFPVVGIGASAGGLRALMALIESLPPEPGIALVVIQHLAPESESLLAEILQHHTSLEVLQVSDEPEVRANHIYVIPPDRTMIIENGHLRLIPRENKRSPHMSIDAFLRSLAEDQTHRAVGVVLSGTGTDGTLGLGAVKAEGGITFAQDESAEHAGMPRSAIKAGCVDYVLPPDEISRELVRIGRHPYVGKVDTPIASDEQGRQKIIRLLAERTGVDFSNYRSSTLYRRISRRMLLLKLESLDEYAKLLRREDRELSALYSDILISVTSFFRDPQAYESIKENVLPHLIKASNRKEPLRVWVMGCSTGEEAYSLAIAITEYADAQKLAIAVQIFSTDLNEAGIDHARLGFYNKNISEDVSPERLRRFFIETDDGYQIAKSIRDMCIFAKQNVLTDPPFSNISLISCRNMLIYLEPALQKRVLPLFHYAIKPSGFLWLGSSETIGSFTDLFEGADTKHRIYRKKPGANSAGAASFSSPSWDRGRPELSRRRPLQNQPATDAFSEADKIALNRYAPPGVLVSVEMEILQFRGDTSPYLAAPAGRPSTNLLKMARQGLLISLRLAMQRALKEKRVVLQEGVISETGRSLDIEVIPVKRSGSFETTYLILFLERESGLAAIHVPAPAQAVRNVEGDSAFVRLTQELDATREYLQAMVEQQEAANEELQSANEEIQSSNEELQSFNEEMQTSKEEVQSANEELNTVNDELRHRNNQLNLANSDLTNFLSGTHLPLVVLGRDLTVRRYTPRAEKMFSLIPSDIGRPITDVKFQFGPVDLDKLLKQVIDSITTVEVEVTDREGKWYSLRICPYRSLDNQIDGALLVLVDIDSQKRLLMATELAKTYAESVLAAIPTPVLVLDVNFQVRTASETFYKAFQVSKGETEGRTIFALGNHQWDIPALRTLLQKIVSSNSIISDFEMTHTFQRIGKKSMLLNGRNLIRKEGDEQLILLTIQDISDRVEATEALLTADQHKDEFLGLLAHELRNPLTAIVHSLDHMRDNDKVVNDAVMRRQTQKLIRLVDDLLDVSRIARGAITLQTEVLDFREALNHTISSYGPQLDAKSQTLNLLLPEMPVAILADKVRLDQIVSNLVNNAIKFTPDDGKIDVSLTAPNGMAVLSVSDSGIGIPEELLPHVFDLFYQADQSLSRDSFGQGIGLALVKRLTEQHNGKVQALSKGQMQGATFIVSLPISKEPIAVKKEVSTKHRGKKGSHKYLVVDDYADGADMLATVLRVEGHDVTVAYNGTSALEAVIQSEFDVIVTDLAMPGVDGFEFTRLVRQLPIAKRPVIIVQTGYAGPEYEKRATAAGCDALVLKPVSYITLLEHGERLITANA